MKNGALEELARLLAPAAGVGAEEMPSVHTLDGVIAALQLRVKAGSGHRVPEDAQFEALRRFAETGRIDNLRDARLVCFGACLPLGEGRPCVIDNAERLAALLAAVDRWIAQPRFFRRCYQGLLRSYFRHEGRAISASPAAHQGWETLRVYLRERLRRLVDPHVNPDWVVTAVASPHLYSNQPAQPYAAAMLRGDAKTLDRLCEQLGIDRASWFLRELVLAQIREATRLGDAGFRAVVATLLEWLGRYPALRERGMALLLQRWAQLPKQPDEEDASLPARVPAHAGLRHAAVLCLGNPWLESNAMRWAEAGEPARLMVGAWLKHEWIGQFHAAPGEGPVHAGPDRRARFWRRYAGSMQRLHLALHASAEGSVPSALHRRMDGFRLELEAANPRAGEPSNSALVMVMADVVLVEFGVAGIGLFGFDTGRPLPFDLSRPVSLDGDGAQSLRSAARQLWLPHHDGIRGWLRWEDMFEAMLRQQYGLEPDGAVAAPRRARTHVDLSGATASGPAADAMDDLVPHTPDALDAPRTGLSAHWQTAEAAAVPFSRADLAIFAKVHNLRVEAATSGEPGLWVRFGDEEENVSWVLGRWGFDYRGAQGWWRRTVRGE